VPVPNAIFLWQNLDVRNVYRTAGKLKTRNIRVDITVEGASGGKKWTCGLEFDYANEESIYCRPLRLDDSKDPSRMPIPDVPNDMHMAFLPPMSGLATSETRLDPGAIAVRVGEGRTAEVLRNLCYLVGGTQEKWQYLHDRIRELFGVRLNPPEYLPERGEIVMTYQDPSDIKLDLSCAGRGMQQTLLLLAHLSANPNSVLLLDEPDAHLEVLRQRQIYDVLTETALEQRSQVIAASHSEVVLNEAAGRHTVVAFLGKPHRIDDRGFQLLKSLRNIGYDDYYQAEQTGWVLYLEGSTDLAILRAFARLLDHPVQSFLERPFFHAVGNKPSRAYDHYFGLREAKQDLVAYAVYDQLDQQLEDKPGLHQHMLKRREIENYFCTREVLIRWADERGTREAGPLFRATWRTAMEKCIEEIERAMRTQRKRSPWSVDCKVSDEFLAPLFENFFEGLDLPNLMRKSDYHELVGHLLKEDVDSEIIGVLDELLEVAKDAKPA
jgi:hypothetical protein